MLWTWHWSSLEDASHEAGTGAGKMPCYGVGPGAGQRMPCYGAGTGAGQRMPVTELALEQVKCHVMELALE